MTRITLSRCVRPCIAFLACASVLPFAVANPQQATHPAASVTHAAARPGNGVSHLCFDKIFYIPFPGKTNYCLALRDWSHGHYRNGLEFLKLAAGWGNKNAQYTLGLIYYGGHHVPADPALGIAWLKLADERHNDPQITLATRSALKWATAAQREQADQLFDRMRHTYGDKVAAARAWHHLQHWKLSNYKTDRGCITLFGPQAEVALKVGMAVPSAGGAGVCVRLQTQRQVVQQATDQYFRGLVGNVTVGPLQTVPAPATSSGH